MAAQAKRRHKIIYSILGVLLVVSLVPMGLLGWWLIQPIRDEVSTKEREILLEKARRISSVTDSLVRRHRSSLEEVATGLALMMENAGPDQFTDMIDHYGLLARYQSTNREVYGLHLDIGGRQFESLRRPEVFASGLIQSNLAVAQESILSGRPYFYSRPFLLGSPPQSAMLVTVPIVLGDDRVVGSLSGVISLSPLVRLVVEGYGSGSNTVYVLDPDGQLVAHSNYSLVLEGVNLTDNELVRKRAQEQVAVGHTSEFDLVTELGKQPMLGAYYPVSSLDWTVFIQSERAQAYSTVRKMMQRLWLSMLGGALIAIIAAFIFAENLSWPIRALAAKTRSMAQGDFAQRVDINSKNELGELADTFNLMSEKIETYIYGLKRALETNKQLFLGCVRTMAAAIDEKDPYTRGHSDRVDRYSLILARRLGLEKAEMHRLHIGALLHDVGKIGIDDRILKKPAALTKEEFEIMKQHPTKGATIIEPIEALNDVLPIIKYHHEKFDGTGYPEGLSGENIPYLARIVTVADTFDAMTTERPYQRAMTFEVALSKMIEFKGKALDPHLVDAFVQAYREGDLEQERRQDEVQQIQALEAMETVDAQQILERAG